MRARCTYCAYHKIVQRPCHRCKFFRQTGPPPHALSGKCKTVNFSRPRVNHVGPRAVDDGIFIIRINLCGTVFFFFSHLHFPRATARYNSCCCRRCDSSTTRRDVSRSRATTVSRKSRRHAYYNICADATMLVHHSSNAIFHGTVITAYTSIIVIGYFTRIEYRYITLLPIRRILLMGVRAIRARHIMLYILLNYFRCRRVKKCIKINVVNLRPPPPR